MNDLVMVIRWAIFIIALLVMFSIVTTVADTVVIFVKGLLTPNKRCLKRRHHYKR